MTRRTRRSARTARVRRAALVAVLLAAVLALLLPRVNIVAQSTERYADDVAASALAVYVTLRALNAVLSTAQEVELSGQFVVGGSAQPLKALEPIDDTIERVAGAVFAVMLLSAILSISAVPVASVGALVAASGAVLALLARGPALSRFGVMAALYGGLLAVVLPFIITVGGLGGDLLTRAAWEENAQIVAEITQPYGDPAFETAPGAAQGMLSRLWSGAGDAVDTVRFYQGIAAKVWVEADTLIASYIKLLAIFAFKIVLMPLVAFGVCYLVLRRGPAVMARSG